MMKTAHLSSNLTRIYVVLTVYPGLFSEKFHGLVVKFSVH